MEIPSPQKLLQLIDAWMAVEQRHGLKLTPENCGFYRDRMNLMLKSADHARFNHYRGNPDPSPLKIAACCTHAIAVHQPLVAHHKPGEDQGAVNRITSMRSASLAMYVGLYIVSNSTYKCNLKVKPPYHCNWPSDHFYCEMRRSLACDELNVTSLAYIYELILLSSAAGKPLAGSLDD